MPQPGYNGRTVDYPRGHVLGGSTAISDYAQKYTILPRRADLGDKDLMVYCRGSRDDYDRWANVTADNGWTWDALYNHMLDVSFASTS